MGGIKVSGTFLGPHLYYLIQLFRLAIVADINIPGFDMQIKILNFRMDVVSSRARKSEQNESAGIE
jgi:hypothetical protein